MDTETIMTTQTAASKKEVLKQPGLGERLKSARDTLRLTEREAAARLHLNPKVITMIEAESFDGTPETFLRGYIRSYARLLNFPESEINAAFTELQTSAVQSPLPIAIPVEKAKVSLSVYRYIRQATYFIAGGLIILVGLWWASHPKDTVKTIKPAAPASMIAAPAPETTTAKTTANTPTTPVATEATKAAASSTQATTTKEPSKETTTAAVKETESDDTTTNDLDDNDDVSDNDVYN